MFKKILIANRGEIACRIIRSAKKMGIKTVAVFSDADIGTPHSHYADEAVNIGPAKAHMSYLNIDAILEACRKTAVDAVHPGYGFLSENAELTRALEKNNITFIGPNTHAVQSMGDKIVARDIAVKAGVHVVPGTENAIENPQEIIQAAQKIGYPIMIKAAAGGGGKGMRVVQKAEDVKENAQRAISEAQSSFGDGRVFVEKYITKPRHIEIQILADKHGHCIHLGERECSIQRRNQKIIEEAPSPFISTQKRKEMGECAVKLAQSVHYDSAGTVEFIADENANFYFLEMNTRLQVEHPVTELITGIDIVEAMIRIAAGEKLNIRQEDVSWNGHAIECRIYAEDPKRNFLPSTGRLTQYRPPKKINDEISKDATIRIDDGVYEGSEISPWYDPMIAKFCVHAPDRIAAGSAMMHALNQFQISGIAHNLSFLTAIMAHPKWDNGDISTDFIPEIWPKGYDARAEKKLMKKMMAVALFITIDEEKRFVSSSHHPKIAEHYIKKAAKCGKQGEWSDISVKMTQNKNYEIIFHEKKEHTYLLSGEWNFPFWSGYINDSHITMQVRREKNALYITTMGAEEYIYVTTPNVARLTQIIPPQNEDNITGEVRSPMPGLVISVDVSEGQKIHHGDVLCVIEAMKMENIIRAEKNGVISSIKVAPGDLIASDGVLLEIT